MAETKIRNMSPASFDIFFLLASLAMVVLLGGAIKLLFHWKSERDVNEKLIREKLEAELKFLKSQLNPHFLFNTLNNLYYLSTQKSERTSAAILQLSEILDYVLHHGSAKFVSLGEELKQMENYIELEKLRYENRVVINQKTEGVITDRQVPPMLLITLIENAFKHGVMPTSNPSYIDILIRVNGSTITVHIENSRWRESSGYGIGLKNLQNQLEVLYSGRHEFIVERMPKTFIVNLTLLSRNESQVSDRR